MQNRSPFGVVFLIAVFLTSAVLLLEYCKPTVDKAVQKQEEYSYVGDSKCQNCHAREYDLWKTSDHFKAMLPASDSTVS